LNKFGAKVSEKLSFALVHRHSGKENTTFSVSNPGITMSHLQLLPTELKPQSTLQIESDLILFAALTGLLAKLATAVTVITKVKLVCSKKNEDKPEGEGAPAPEKPSLCHFHYGNSTELGLAGQFATI